VDGWVTIGKTLVIIGGGIALLGGLVWLVGKSSFLGRLPGDIRIEREGFTCVIPLATSIVLSILLTVILNIILRSLKR